jgi:penicillin-binding protein 1A
MWMDFMKAAIAGKPTEAFPEGNAPKKELEVPLTPPAGSPVVKAIPKAPVETDPDAIEPDENAAPSTPPGIPAGDGTAGPAPQ